MSHYKPWKGFEKQIVQLFRKLGWKDAKRNWSEQFGKKSGKDILNTEPYCVQVKHQDRPSLLDAWCEAELEAGKGEIPVGICRFKKIKKTLVVMQLKDFIWLIK